MKIGATAVKIGAALILSSAGGVAYHSTYASCIIGVTGTNASVTVRGWGAPAVCRAAIQDGRKWAYARDEIPTEPVLCEIEQHHRRYIVRDAGVFMIVGRSLCADLIRSNSL